jgi:hypothetical protein
MTDAAPFATGMHLPMAHPQRNPELDCVVLAAGQQVCFLPALPLQFLGDDPLRLGTGPVQLLARVMFPKAAADPKMTRAKGEPLSGAPARAEALPSRLGGRRSDESERKALRKGGFDHNLVYFWGDLCLNCP